MRSTFFSRVPLGFCLLTFAFSQPIRAQIPSRSDTTSTPVMGVGHDYIKSVGETVNPANGSLSIRIAVPVPPSRGFTLPFNFSYDSGGAYYLTSIDVNSIDWDTNRSILSQGGWSYSAPTMSVQKTIFYGQNDLGNPVTCYALINYVMQDANGGTHNLGLTYKETKTDCNVNQDEEVDATGQEGSVVASTTATWYASQVNAVTVTDGDGTNYNFPAHLGQPSTGRCAAPCVPTTYVGGVSDRNGNGYGITSNAAGGGHALTYVDSIGRTALDIPTFGASPDSVTVSGITNPYYVFWTNLQPNFPLTFTHVNDGSASCGVASSGGQPAVSVISSITLPNNQQYTFSYDPTYGVVNKITYPSGGYVRYVWGVNTQSELSSGNATSNPPGILEACNYIHDQPAILHRYVSFDGTTEVLQQDFSYSTTWIANSPSWSQKQTTVTTHDLVTGAAYSTIYTYGSTYVDNQPNAPGFRPQIPVENSIKYYADTNTSGTPLRIVTKSWRNERVLNQQQTVLDNNLTAETDWNYDSNEMETDHEDYDYGSGTRGSLIRKTVIPSYHVFSQHIVDKPDSVQVQDGSGATVAGVSYGYDANGNLTSRSDWLNSTGSSVLTTSHTYDTYGNITSTTDPKGNPPTQYFYDDSFVDSCPYTSPAQAYLTKVVYPTTSLNGIAHVETFKYYCASGALASSTDQNSQTTTYQYNDPFIRPTQISYPDGGLTTFAYNDSPYNASASTPNITTTRKMDSANSIVTLATFDGLGHQLQTQLTSDPEGTDYTTTTYDGLGRPFTVSNPYRSSPYPTTQYHYDALGRTSSVTEQDGSTIVSSFTGNCGTVADEAGKSRKSCSDALGRLTGVWEDPAGLNYETDYQYNTLGNLLEVDQKGDSPGNSANWRKRTFTYDMHSRLLTASNPESGTITYTYDADSNVATKTDARGVITTNTYDELNRVTEKTYSGTSLLSWFVYDLANTNGVTLANPIGRMVLAEYANAGENAGTLFSYDAMGRIANNWQWMPMHGGWAFSYHYWYDLAGHLTQSTNYQGETAYYYYDSAGRPTSMTGNFAGQAFNFVTSAQYSPDGALTSAYVGGTGPSNAITISNAYNSRLQPSSLSATASSGGSILNLSYNFGFGAGDNGNVLGITNNRDASRSLTGTINFGYDALNRIQSATTTGTDCTQNGTGFTRDYGESFSIDPWGNLNGITTTKCTAENPLLTADTNNHIVGYYYDAAGNLLKQGGCCTADYSYDPEGYLTSALGNAYYYDAFGRRDQKNSSKFYVYDTGSNVIAEGDATGNFTEEYVYFGGRKFARIDVPLGTVHYYFSDHLGSHSVVTDASGNIEQEQDFTPYGGERTLLSGPNNYKFTGKERDSETGLDYFGARYYSSSMGRFLVADWNAVPVPVPYADFGDPQSLNQYSYVRNNPISRVDVDGHCSGDECRDITVKAEVTKTPVLTAGKRLGIYDTARVNGQVTYTFTYKGQPLAKTEIQEDVKSQTTVNGTTIEPKSITGPGTTDEKGQAVDNVGLGEKVLNVTNSGSNSAAVDMSTNAYKGDVKQTLSFDSPSGDACSVTETRTLTNIGPNGNGTSQFRIELTSPTTQSATPTDLPRKEPM